MPAGRVSLFYQGDVSGAGQIFTIEFNNDTLRVLYDGGATYTTSTSAVFRDPSAWYHVVVSSNTTTADPNKTSIYVNGVLQTIVGTPPPLNYTTVNGTTSIHRIGFVAQYFDGYLTEVNFIDGQALTPSSFGQIESTTGVWSPKQYAGSYGTNGFYLKFGNTSSVAALGTDSSGNGNTWTVNNVSLTAGVTYDSMLDVPVNYSDGGNGRGNYCTLNPLDYIALVTSNGNLTASATSSVSSQFTRGTTQIPIAGKWYWEQTLTSGGLSAVGITLTSIQMVIGGGVTYTNSIDYQSDGNKNVNGTVTAYGATYTNGDVIGVAIDSDAATMTFYKNNVSQGSISINIANGYSPGVRVWSSSVVNLNFGQRPFTYTPPSGFRALNTNNLPTPTIVNGANFMAATTYTGNGAVRSLSNAVNNVSFQPDLVWIKSRTPVATNHALFDSSRGVTKYLSSNTTTAETTLAQSLTALNADGFSLGTDTTLVNASANSYVAWQWRESITAGLDIVTYTGNGANRTIAHNLGVAPAMVIVKRYDAPNTGNWQVRHTSIAAANSIQLNLTNQAAAAATVWNSTAPTSSVFSVGTSTDVNATGGTYAAYCFAEIAGFSKIGSYTGNGLADGPFVFCGFRPRWIMIKITNGSNDWRMFDTSRSGLNAAKNSLLANLADTEDTVFNAIDILSNGFKLRTADNSTNISAGTFIFAAFAEVPSKYALAR
jgi:hypothetical protein